MLLNICFLRSKSVYNRSLMLPFYLLPVYDVHRRDIVNAKACIQRIALYAITNCTKSNEKCYLTEDVIAIYEDNADCAVASSAKVLVDIKSTEPMSDEPVPEYKARWYDVVAVEEVGKDSSNIYTTVP